MKFEELEFKEKPYSNEMVAHTGNENYRGWQALYHADGYEISIIKGFGAWGDEERPYELWWWPMPDVENPLPEHGFDPFGYLTEKDVEYFINEKCYLDGHKFEKYLDRD